jgi:CO dehydrogenase/acetyl-CoA synthase alpha subunit
VVFVVNGNGAIVDANSKEVVLITVAVVIGASSRHTLADMRAVVVTVLETLERNISVNLGRNEDLSERIHGERIHSERIHLGKAWKKVLKIIYIKKPILL